MIRRVTACLVLAGTTALALGACGGSSGSSKASTTGGSDKATATAAPVALTGKVTAHGSKDLAGRGATANLEIEANDFSFGPTYVKVTPGAKVTVALTNTGKAEHTFTIDALGIDENLKPGQKATVQVNVPRDGMLQFHCKFHEAMGMQGAFYTQATTTSPSSGSGPTNAPPSTSARSGY